MPADAKNTLRIPGTLDDNEFGWRARLGLITPSRGWTPEHEWPRLLPKGVSYMVTRIPLKATTPEELERMGKHTFDAAGLLASADIDVLCYGCTVETILQGFAYDRALETRLTEETGKPARTMTGAVMQALESFKTKKLALVTPYIDEINQLELKFMKSIGLDVVYFKGLGIANTVDIARIAPSAVLDLGEEALTKAKDADALFISCGNLRTIDAIPVLEEAFGRPVISSNQALVWSGLRLAGINDQIAGYGRLFCQ